MRNCPIKAAFYKHSAGVQIDIMDLSKIMKAGETAIKEGKDVEEAVIAAIDTYRIKDSASENPIQSDN